jgi:hypothetical protein
LLLRFFDLANHLDCELIEDFLKWQLKKANGYVKRKENQTECRQLKEPARIEK